MKNTMAKMTAKIATIPAIIPPVTAPVLIPEPVSGMLEVLGLTLAAAAVLELCGIVFVTMAVTGGAVVVATGVDCRHLVNR